MAKKILLLGGSGDPNFVNAVAENLGIKAMKSSTKRFGNGEILPKFKKSVRGKNVYLIQSVTQSSSWSVNDLLMETYLLLDGLKRASAEKITVIFPIFPYSRQDRKTTKHEPISAAVVGRMLQKMGTSRLVTMELHSTQTQQCFHGPFDNLFALPVFFNHWKQQDDKNEICIVSPDGGGSKRALAYAKALGNSPFALMDKRRDPNGTIEGMEIVGKDLIKDKKCVIIDDMADSCGTLCQAAKELLKEGAKSVEAWITHPVLSGKAEENLSESQLSKLVVTDTIPLQEWAKKLPITKVLTVAPIVAKAIKAIKKGKSVSKLFKINKVN